MSFYFYIFSFILFLSFNNFLRAFVIKYFYLALIYIHF